MKVAMAAALTGEVTTGQWRIILAAGSVTVIGVVVYAATVLGPPDVRTWLMLCGIIAVLAALQSAALDPSDLAVALLFSAPPVIALVADGSPTWLIGPLAALLLVAGELNALSWECLGTEPTGGVVPRLLNIGRVAALGMAVSLPIGVITPGGVPGGALVVAVAAAVLALAGSAVFSGRR